jgi:predicted ArsR family transcriptional regulator
MLRQLLRLAAGRGTMDLKALANELGTTPALVSQMLDQLQQQGYLQAVVQGCGTPCEHCPLRSACLYRRQPRVWSLTARGEALLSDEEQQ